MEYKVAFLPKSEIEIEVSVPLSELEPYLKKAAALISEKNEIEGFRRGNAPYEIIKNRFGEAAIYERAAELAIKKTYPEIMQELVAKGEISTERPPLGRPEVTVTKLAPGNELQYKAKLAFLPEVKLPDYKAVAQKVRKEKKEVSVSNEEIEKTLEWIRNSRVTGESDGRKVPELTGEFAQSLGNFPTLESLKQSVKDGLQNEKEIRERQRIRARILEEIARTAKIEVPDVLMESESRTMLEELKTGVQNLGLKWEDYLSHLKKTPEELIRDWQEDALNRVKSALCLREIAKLEKIEPTSEEIEARANQFLAQLKSVEEEGRAIDQNELREYTNGVLRNEKVFEFLEGL